MKRFLLPLSLILFVAVKFSLPLSSTDTIGPLALVDTIYVLVLLGLILLISAAIGRKLLSALIIQELNTLEQGVFSLALGLGLLAYGTFSLGLLGFLNFWVILSGLFVIGCLVHREMGDVLDTIPKPSSMKRGWLALPIYEKSALIIGTAILILTLLQSLTPPWDYDGLLYHLQGPRLYLQAGRIYVVPQNWLFNYPSTVEMLFTLGMGLGSDSFAKSLHMFFGVLLVLATLACSRRLVGGRWFWVAGAILLGVPIFPIWASLAYVDLAWASFEFLAVYSILFWVENRSPRWLWLSGIFIGLAIGCKYFSLGSAAILGIWILWQSCSFGWRKLLANGALFSGIALLVGSPWYIKNWLWLGNPVFPMFFSTSGVAAQRLTLWSEYMQSFGVGRSVLDYLLIPIHIYTQYPRFGTFLGSIEIPSLLFPLVLFYPWVKKNSELNSLLWLLILRFGVWTLGSQQTRYLLPIFPSLSILSTLVLISISKQFSRRTLGEALMTGLVLGMVTITLVYSVLFFIKVKPLEVVFGVQSRDAFLRRNLDDYPAINYITNHLPTSSRVLMMWDGRAYYCDQRCLPDVDHTQWTTLIADEPDLVSQLRVRGVTHLLLSMNDLYFILQHDPSGAHKRAYDYFRSEFQMKCTQPVYLDNYVSIFELTCR